MKSKQSWWILLSLPVVLVIVGCSSTPPVVEEPPMEVVAQPAQPVRGNEDALNAAMARAEAARSFIMDINGPQLMPDEWQEAESLYTEAARQRRTTSPRDIQESTNRFNAAADAFEAMTGEAIARYLQFMEQEITAARNAAIAAGAVELAPDFLAQSDQTVVDALEQYDQNEYRAALDGARTALVMYQALESGLGAYAIRERVAQAAQEEAPQALREADVIFEEGFSQWDEGNFTAAKTKAESSRVMYLRAGASAERQRALTVKANVAARENFAPAEDGFNRANNANRLENFAEATRLFVEVTPMFSAAAHLAVQRQQAAEEALRIANERMAASEDLAQTAELILEGGVE